MRPHLALLLPALLLDAIGAQEPSTDLLQRLQQLRADLAAVTAAPPRLGDFDLDLLEQAHISHELSPAELATTVTALRLLPTLVPGDLAAIESHGLSSDDPAVRQALALLLVQQGRMAGAARILGRNALSFARAERSYRTWQWWETMFGTHPDYHTLTRDFTLALLQRFEDGDAAQRAAIADVLGREQLAADQLAGLRTQLALAWQRQEDERRSVAQRDAAHPDPVWVEDRRGLRQVERSQMLCLRSPARRELRLLPADGTATATPWGVLAQRRGTADDLLAKHRLLRELAACAGDPGTDLEALPGPIEVILRPGEDAPELDARLDAVDDALTAAVATAAVLVAAADFELSADAPQRRAIIAVVRDTLTAVREAARIGRALTSPAARSAPPAATAEPAVLTALQSAQGRADAQLAELAAIAAPATGSLRAMAFERAAGGDGAAARGRTHCTLAADGYWVIEFAMAAPGVRISSRTTILTPDSLHDALYEPSGSTLAVTLAHAAPSRWITLPRDGAAAAIRRTAIERIAIECDTEAHVRELQLELQQLAAGTAR